MGLTQYQRGSTMQLLAALPSLSNLLMPRLNRSSIHMIKVWFPGEVVA